MRILRALVVAAMAVALWGTPALAGPPEREEVDFFDLFPDEEHRLAVFVNITRDDFCAWEASGFEGPAPVGMLIPVKLMETGQGAIVASFQSSIAVDIELWQLDEDVPPLLGPCEDTDDQVAPWATGTVRWMANTNDFDVSLTRTNVFGSRLSGTVTDAEGGSWRYVSVFRAQIDRSGEFQEVAVHSILKPLGN